MVILDKKTVNGQFLRLALVIGAVWTGAQTAYAQGFRSPFDPEPRMALVIGNTSYPGDGKLQNPSNDARDMAGTLAGLGFEVDLVIDGKLSDMVQAHEGFAGSLKPGTLALFYFAGHAIEIDGINYLLPVDFVAKLPEDVRMSTLNAQQIQMETEASCLRAGIMILDACRNNPFRTFRGATQGLAPMATNAGSVVAFATGPGKTASDNSYGENGLFTKYLISAMKKPGVTLDAAFSSARRAVFEATGGDQVPWVTSTLTETVFLNPDIAEENRLSRFATLATSDFSSGGDWRRNVDDGGRLWRINQGMANTSMPARPDVQRTPFDLVFGGGNEWSTYVAEIDVALLDQPNAEQYAALLFRYSNARNTCSCSLYSEKPSPYNQPRSQAQTYLRLQGPGIDTKKPVDWRRRDAVRLRATARGNQIACEIVGRPSTRTWATTNKNTVGTVALRTFGTRARFDNLSVVAIPNENDRCTSKP